MPAAAGKKRGPAPKRSSERRRRNKESQPETIVQIGGGPVPSPDPDPAWHPIALDWFKSLRESGQAQFFEPSDWQAARYVAEVMSRNLNQTNKFSSVLFAAVWSAMSDLLTTEAARRRVRMEVDRGDAPAQPAGVVALATYRQNLGVTKKQTSRGTGSKKK